MYNHIIGPYILPAPLTTIAYRLFLQETLPGLLDIVPLAINKQMW